MGDLLPAEHLDWDAEAKAEAAGGEQSSATWRRAGKAASHIICTFAYDHIDIRSFMAMSSNVFHLV